MYLNFLNESLLRFPQKTIVWFVRWMNFAFILGGHWWRCIVYSLYIHRCINTWVYTLMACRWNSKIVSVSPNPDAYIFAELWKEFFIVYCSMELGFFLVFFYNNVPFVEDPKVSRRKVYRVTGKGQCLWGYIGKITVNHKL